MLSLPVLAASFTERQNTAARVKGARERAGATIKRLFAEKGVDYPARELLLRSLKREKMLELWATDEPGGAMTLITTFRICASSGRLGPKRAQGDLQVPEGFYVIDRYNPWSSYHLSLGVNYPNAADRAASKALGIERPGGDIFIHGDCVTIGCVPIEDWAIEQLYLALLDSRLRYGAKAGRTEVHFFPGRLDDDSLRALIDEGEPDEATLELWAQLKRGWEAFEATKKRPRVSVDQHGRYVVPKVR